MQWNRYQCFSELLESAIVVEAVEQFPVIPGNIGVGGQVAAGIPLAKAVLYHPGYYYHKSFTYMRHAWTLLQRVRCPLIRHFFRR
jgi:hypothetical protein